MPGYSIGQCVFCEKCALTVKDEQGRVFVWKTQFGEIYSCSQSLTEYEQELAPANRVPFSQGYNEAFPCDNTDLPDGEELFKCESCGVTL